MFSLPEGHVSKEGLKVLTWVAKIPLCQAWFGGCGRRGSNLASASSKLRSHSSTSGCLGENVSPKLTNFSLN